MERFIATHRGIKACLPEGLPQHVFIYRRAWPSRLFTMLAGNIGRDSRQAAIRRHANRLCSTLQVCALSEYALPHRMAVEHTPVFHMQHISGRHERMHK
jgi:hypothetical protein